MKRGKPKRVTKAEGEGQRLHTERGEGRQWEGDASGSITKGDVTSRWSEKLFSRLIFTPLPPFLLPFAPQSPPGHHVRIHHTPTVVFLLHYFCHMLPSLTSPSPFLQLSGSAASPLPSLWKCSVIGCDQECPPDASISPHSKRLNYTEINGVLELGCR